MLITHAFTLCPLYVEAILGYDKDVENRSWRLPEDFIGAPLALHAGGIPCYQKSTFSHARCWTTWETLIWMPCRTAASLGGYGLTGR